MDGTASTGLVSMLLLCISLYLHAHFLWFMWFLIVVSAVNEVDSTASTGLVSMLKDLQDKYKIRVLLSNVRGM